MKPDEVIIIGAGPAGATAAIQLKRYGIPFLLLEKERVGGLLWNANLVENYPGFPSGVSGPKLVGLIEKQMERLGVDVTLDSVLQLRYSETGFQVKTSRAEYHPRFVIIASGTKPISLPIPVPETARSKVFSDVHLLLPETNKKIVIVGAGDAAFDYALNLTKNRNSVTILNRGRDVKCLGLLWERARAETGIEYCVETPVCQVVLDETADRLRVQTEAHGSLVADYLLFATGRVPQVSFLPDEIINNNLEGVYFVGDVKNGLYRQAIIAAGDGLRAAMDIYHKLNSEAAFI
jgi:thioredoxin reductase (NADPH)